MDTDFLDFIVEKLVLLPGQQQALKAKICAYTMERAMIQLGDTLTPDERETAQAFLTAPTPSQNILQHAQALFSTPDRYDVLTYAFLEVLRDFVDDENVFTPAQREAVLADLENYFSSRLTTAS